MRPINRRTVRDLFNALEDAAGVEHVEGRALYGLRRLSADLAEDSGETDAGVLARAAQVRRKIRPAGTLEGVLSKIA